MQSWKTAFSLLFLLVVFVNIRIFLIDNPFSKTDKLPNDCMIVQLQHGATVYSTNVSSAILNFAKIKTNQSSVVGNVKKNKVYLTIGIPVIKRINGAVYLFQLLDHIIQRTTNEDKLNNIVVVFLADFDRSFNIEVIKNITAKYSKYLDLGFLQILQAARSFYPSLENLKRNYNDKLERVKWRSKQVADFVFLFLYCRNLSQYYMQLEDDVIPSIRFISKISDFIDEQRWNWAVLEFSELGFIGKLFKSSDLLKLARFMLTFYDEMPVDWLIRHFRSAMAQDQVIMRKPTLFQHYGVKSSFDTSRENNLKDHFFDDSEKRWEGDDPAATLVTDLKHYDRWSSNLLYRSSYGYFWAKDIKKDSSISLIFDKPQKLRAVHVETGIQSHPSDILENGVVEVSSKFIKRDIDSVTCDNFIKLGDFVRGKFSMNNITSIIPNTFATECLRVRATLPQESWVVFNQIAVFTSNSSIH